MRNFRISLSIAKKRSNILVDFAHKCIIGVVITSVQCFHEYNNFKLAQYVGEQTAVRGTISFPFFPTSIRCCRCL